MIDPSGTELREHVSLQARYPLCGVSRIHEGLRKIRVELTCRELKRGNDATFFPTLRQRIYRRREQSFAGG